MITKNKQPAKTRAAIKRSSARAPVLKQPGAARAKAPVTAAVTELVGEPAPPNLLRAGLKALGHARDEVVQRQGRVFEVLLGIGPAQAWSGLVKHDAAIKKATQETFGLRKFEAVFDDRVARALERMGMPSIETLQGLTDEVAALKAELRSLKTVQRKR